MIFVGLPGYDFFYILQKHLSPEVSSWLYFSSFQSVKMVQYFPLSDVTLSCTDISDLSSSVFFSDVHVPYLHLVYTRYYRLCLSLSLQTLRFLACLPPPRADAFLRCQTRSTLSLLLDLFLSFFSEQFFTTTITHKISEIQAFFFWFSFYTELKFKCIGLYICGWHTLIFEWS